MSHASALSSGESAPDTAEGPSTGGVREGEAPRNGSVLGALSRLGARGAVVLVWLALICLYGALEPDLFLTTGTFQTIFGSQQALVFLSIALLCTICVGEFVDLSVASVFGLCAVAMTVLTVEHGWGPWAASAAAVALGAGCGAVNGLLVVRLGVNVIVVTLGMGTFLLGIALWTTDLLPVSGIDREFSRIALEPVLGLPLSFYEGLLLVLVFAYVLHLTPLGRNMRFVAANREVSRLAGVRVDRIRFGAFVAAGTICGLGGALAAAATGGFDPSVSQSYLLPTFAAAFLGTAVLMPGRFNPLGTWLAIYFLATGILGLQLMGVAAWVSSVFYGGVLILAVTLSTVLNRRSA